MPRAFIIIMFLPAIPDDCRRLSGHSPESLEETVKVTSALLDSELPVIVDADAHARANQCNGAHGGKLQHQRSCFLGKSAKDSP